MASDNSFVLQEVFFFFFLVFNAFFPRIRERAGGRCTSILAFD